MKRSRLRRRKKLVTRRDKIIRAIEDLHPRYIRTREPACVTCGKTENGQCGHLFSRAFLSLRWDTRLDGNCRRQCSGCNAWHEHHAERYTNWYIETHGLLRWQQLLREYNTPKHYTIGELETLKLELEEKLAARDRVRPDCGAHAGGSG